MLRFYVKQALTIGENLSLPQEVVNHINVLRLKLSEIITLFDGCGNSYQAQIIHWDRKEVIVEIINKNDPEIQAKLVPIHIGLSLISQDKLDFAIQKLIELGVSEISLIESQYSQRIKSERLANRINHWQNTIISSCEQCGLNTLPKLNSPVKLEEFVTKQSATPNNFIMSLRGNESGLNLAKSQIVNLLIGPEGGFSENEEDLAAKNNFKQYKLNTPILKAETAAIVTAGIFRYLIS